MLDGVLTSFFVPTHDYVALSDIVKTTLDEQYFVTNETVVASTASKKYWSNIWDELQPCVITETGLLPANNFSFNTTNPLYTVLRPKELLSDVFNEEAIIMRSMASPLITIQFYDGSNPIALDGRVTVIPCETPRSFIVTRKIVTYAIEDLEPIQLDYVNELFTCLWQQIYDEQEANYDEEDFARGRPPVNGLISQFVVAMTFERQVDDCFLSFHYELYNRTLGKAKVVECEGGEVKLMVLDKEAELPPEIEILAVIPLAEDDDAELSVQDMEHVTVDEDGEQAVQFSVTGCLLRGLRS